MKITDKTMHRICQILLIFCLALMVLVVCGCGPRLSDGQALELSQSRANIVASRAVESTESKKLLSDAANARTMAATTNLELPEPITDSAILIQDPVAVTNEASAADASEKHPPEGGTSFLAILGVGTMTLLGVLRYCPGAYGALADTLRTVLAPALVKRRHQSLLVADKVAEAAVKYGDRVTDLAKRLGAGDIVENIQLQEREVATALGIRDAMKDVLVKNRGEPCVV